MAAQNLDTPEVSASGTDVVVGAADKSTAAVAAAAAADANNALKPPASTAQLEAVLKRQNKFDVQFAAANRHILGQGESVVTALSSTAHTQSPGIASLASMIKSDSMENAVGTATADLQHMIKSQLQGGSGSTDANAPGTAEVLDSLLDFEAAGMQGGSAKTVTTPSSGSSRQSASRAANTNSTGTARTTSGLVAPDVPASVLNSMATAAAEPLNVSAGLHKSAQQNNVVVSVRVGNQVVEVPIALSTMTTQPTVTASSQLSLDTQQHNNSRRSLRFFLSQAMQNKCKSPSTAMYDSDNTAGAGYGEGNDSNDNSRRAVLDRNKMAAVRYRKRKREEQSRMTDALDMLKRDNVDLETRVRVLTRELSVVNAKLRRYELRCTCGAGGASSYGDGGDVVVDVLDHQQDTLPSAPSLSRHSTAVSATSSNASNNNSFGPVDVVSSTPSTGSSGGGSGRPQFYAVPAANGQIMLVPSSSSSAKREH